MTLHDIYLKQRLQKQTENKKIFRLPFEKVNINFSIQKLNQFNWSSLKTRLLLGSGERKEKKYQLHHKCFDVLSSSPVLQ